MGTNNPHLVSSSDSESYERDPRSDVLRDSKQVLGVSLRSSPWPFCTVTWHQLLTRDKSTPSITAELGLAMCIRASGTCQRWHLRHPGSSNGTEPRWGNRGQVTPQQTPDNTGHRLRCHPNHIEKTSNPVPVGKGRIRRWHRLVEWMVSG